MDTASTLIFPITANQVHAGSKHVPKPTILGDWMHKSIYYRLKKYNIPIFAHSIGLNISIHRHYTRMGLD